MDLDFDFLAVTDQTGLVPENYQYFNQLLNKRTIVLNTEIKENIVELVYLPLKDFEEDNINAPVTLIINSMGGSVSDSYFLAHYISTYKKPLNIIVTGCAASMATILLCGGTHNSNVIRYCFPSSYALIHDGYVALSASEAKTASDIMEFNNRVDSSIKDFIIKNSSITEELYDAHARKQWFLDANDMKKYNLIDHIYGVDE